MSFSKPKTPNPPPALAAPANVETTEVTKLVRDISARRGRGSTILSQDNPAPYGGKRRSTLLGSSQ